MQTTSSVFYIIHRTQVSCPLGSAEPSSSTTWRSPHRDDLDAPSLLPLTEASPLSPPLANATAAQPAHLPDAHSRLAPLSLLAVDSGWAEEAAAGSFWAVGPHTALTPVDPRPSDARADDYVARPEAKPPLAHASQTEEWGGEEVLRRAAAAAKEVETLAALRSEPLIDAAQAPLRKSRAREASPT